MQALSTVNLPLSTTLITSPQKSGYAVHSVSVNSMKSFISFFISYLTQQLFNKKLFSFHEFVDFLLFMLLLIFSFNLWWSDRMQGQKLYFELNSWTLLNFRSWQSLNFQEFLHAIYIVLLIEVLHFIFENVECFF